MEDIIKLLTVHVSLIENTKTIHMERLDIFVTKLKGILSGYFPLSSLCKITVTNYQSFSSLVPSVLLEVAYYVKIRGLVSKIFLRTPPQSSSLMARLSLQSHSVLICQNALGQVYLKYFQPVATCLKPTYDCTQSGLLQCCVLCLIHAASFVYKNADIHFSEAIHAISHKNAQKRKFSKTPFKVNAQKRVNLSTTAL